MHDIDISTLPRWAAAAFTCVVTSFCTQKHINSHVCMAATAPFMGKSFHTYHNFGCWCSKCHKACSCCLIRNLKSLAKFFDGRHKIVIADQRQCLQTYNLKILQSMGTCFFSHIPEIYTKLKWHPRQRYNQCFRRKCATQTRQDWFHSRTPKAQ